jgi:hypothetical protein
VGIWSKIEFLLSIENFSLGNPAEDDFFPLPSGFDQSSISEIVPTRVAGDRIW